MNGEQREYWMGRRGLHWINMKQIDGECCVFVNATNILSLMFLAFETLFFSCSSSSSHLLRGPSVKYFDCPSHKRDRSTVADWRLFYIVMVFIIPKSDELILFLSWRIQKMYCLPLGILFLFDTDVVDMAYS